MSVGALLSCFRKPNYLQNYLFFRFLYQYYLHFKVVAGFIYCWFEVSVNHFAYSFKKSIIKKVKFSFFIA